MATETYTTIQQLPENLQKYQEQMLATVFGTEGQPGLVGTQRPVPDYQQFIQPFTQAQQQAFQQAQQGLGAYQPFLQAGAQTQATGIGTLGQAAQMFTPGAQQAFMNPYQQAVTQEALKEISRQGDIAQQQASAQAVKAGAFGGGREGVVRAELGRNIQDIKSQRIAEDLARNYAQAQQAAQQAGLGLGQVGAVTGQMGLQQAGLGQLAQQLGLKDIGTLLDIGGMQQQLGQAGLEAQLRRQQEAIEEPYTRLAFASDILRGTPYGMTSISQRPADTTSPIAQGLGLGLTALGGLGSLGSIFGKG